MMNRTMKRARASTRGPPIPAPTAARVAREYEEGLALEVEFGKTVVVAPAIPIFDICAGESSRVPASIVKVDLVEQSLLHDQVLFPQGVMAFVELDLPDHDVSRQVLGDL
jgi:hypothetical protein